MRCEKCGANIDDGFKFCTKCGTMVTVEKKAETSFSVGQTPEMGNFVPNEPQGTKRKSKLPYIMIGVGAIALVLLIVFANFAALENAVRKMTSSPEEYYQWVEEKQLKEAAKIVTSVYENYFIEAVQAYDRKTELEMSYAFEEGADDWLEILEDVGVDLSWLDSGKIAWTHSLKEGVMEEGVGVSLSDVELMEIRAFADYNEEAMYVGVPTLSPYYLSCDLDDIVYDGGESTRMSLELMKNIDKALPTVIKLNKLLDKYTEIALSYVDDVDMTKGKTLRVAEISKDYTRLEVTIDAKMVSEMMEGIFAALGEDEEIKEIIFSMCGALEETKDLDLDVDADDIYDEFTDACSELEDMAGEIDGDGEIVMFVYVDGKGDVVGREIEVYDGTISMLWPEDGKKVGYQFGVETDYMNITVEGNGKKSGNKVTGDFVFECDGNELIEFSLDKLDEEALKEGFVNGTIEVKLASEVSDLFDSIYGYDYYGIGELNSMLQSLEDISLVLNSDMSKSKMNFTLSAKEQDEKLVTFDIAYSVGDGKVASIPKDKLVYDVTDEDDIEEWWENLEWSTLLKNLDKTSLPSEVVDLIDELSDLDVDEFEDYFGGIGYSEAAVSSSASATTETKTDAAAADSAAAPYSY